MSSHVVPNPVANSYSAKNPPPISTQTHYISGIKCTVYGLSELSPSTTELSCLWLLHPRLATQSSMSPFAAHIITSWNAHPAPNNNPSIPKRGLIAISFDQRNHGTRQVSPLANEAWRSPKQSNPRHAPDMFSIYHGTAVDTSQLLDHLPAYIFPPNRSQRAGITITQNLVLGVSLGGHAAWHVLMQDPRFTAAVVAIGCPDYVRLMTDRARLSKLASYTDSTPAGAAFVGGVDFPPGLVEVVGRYDPAAVLWGAVAGKGKGKTGAVTGGQEQSFGEVGPDEMGRVVPVMARCLGNKRILNLSGGDDKLVPYHCSKPFLDWLKKAIGKGGWYEGGGVYLEDIIVPDCGHDVPPAMVKEMVRFVVETLDQEQDRSAGKRGSKESRI